MLRHNYAELFSDDPAWLDRAQHLAARTYEFTEYLVDVLGVDDVGRDGTGRSRTIPPATCSAGWASTASPDCS